MILLRLESAMLEFSAAFRQPEMGRLMRELRQLIGRIQEKFAAVLGVGFSPLNPWENAIYSLLH